MKTFNLHKTKWILIILCAIIVAALAISCGTIAKADDTDAVTPTPVDTAKITNTVTAPNISTFSETSTYTFTKASYNGDDSETAKAKMPAISNTEILISAAEGTVSSDITKVAGTTTDTYSKSANFSKLVIGTEGAEPTTDDTFTYAGVHEYTFVRTIAHAAPSATATDWSTETKTTFTLRVYVNHDSTQSDKFQILGVTMFEGTTEPSEESKKIAEAKDTNIFKPLRDLKINNVVTGDMGSKTQDFTYAISMTDDYLTTSSSVIGVVVDASSTPTTAVTFSTATAGKATASDINLKHGYKIVFDGTTAYKTTTSTKLDVGTQYSITETGVTGYKVCSDSTFTSYDATPAKVEHKAKFKADTYTAAGEGIILKYDSSKTESELTPTGTKTNEVSTFATNVGQYNEATSNADYNVTTITNYFPNIEPTGFLIDAAPYALLIGIPILVVILSLVVRRKR